MFKHVIKSGSPLTTYTAEIQLIPEGNDTNNQLMKCGTEMENLACTTYVTRQKENSHTHVCM